MINQQNFETQALMFDALASACQTSLQDALETKKQASFVVSGGRTPIALFERMVEANLPWGKIDLALVDERWVPGTHERSNALLVQNHLLNTLASRGMAIPQFTGLYHPTETAAESVAVCEAQYQEIARPFDITILGMGPAGHTASLFPHAKGLEHALSNRDSIASIVAQPSEVTGEEVERMTLTRHGILNSKKVVLVVTGQDKLDVLNTALKGDNIAEMPVRAILNQNQLSIEVYWAP